MSEPAGYLCVQVVIDQGRCKVVTWTVEHSRGLESMWAGKIHCLNETLHLSSPTLEPFASAINRNSQIQSVFISLYDLHHIFVRINGKFCDKKNIFMLPF